MPSGLCAMPDSECEGEDGLLDVLFCDPCRRTDIVEFCKAGGDDMPYGHIPLNHKERGRFQFEERSFYQSSDEA
ncbi:hypothetical protein AK812_SmicGene31873 [Symbiodinium microadriaticum]|uniref:Uncharacterized protein n=1 Tax=Symbiodinium microadriaticum TaxID=2951 RepID=A0A1Q9CVL6_SYMMI|nr:hypothetical protein AK812_SmicGene31873 [Symbiodinium microadriaticum]